MLASILGAVRLTGFVCAAAIALGALAAAAQSTTPARIVGNARVGYRLLRGDQPYFIRGVGVDRGSLAAAAQAGANSVRTWGADRLGSVLDQAQAEGLTVTAGIWLGHSRHGFNYHDPVQVARQRDMVRRIVEAHKNHPGLLIWALGNEMEGDGTDEAVWRAVEDLAAMVKQLDPHHPTMTIIAELGENGWKAKAIHQLCPSIDIVGINSYGGVATLAERYRAAGGVRPYCLTEFGPLGWWEAPRTPWGAALEPTSTAKAGTYEKAYRAAVQNQPLCLGSFAFLWGWKQEATATWFGLLLPSGERLGGVDRLTELWTGVAPRNRCPEVEPLMPTDGLTLAAGETFPLRLQARDPDDDTLSVTWELQAEGTPIGGGDPEPNPRRFPEAILESSTDRVVVRLPEASGAYRLFVTVRDGRGGAATANLPIQAKPQ